MPSSETDNIEECSLEDLVLKGSLYDIMRKLKITPALLDDENYHDYSLVTTALSKKYTHIAKFLIEKGFRVYKKFKIHAEKTALHYATEIGELQLIRTILLKGAALDIIAIDENGKTPLEIAINREEVDDILTVFIFNVEIAILDDMFLLHYSVKNHNLKLLKLLLKRGLSPIKKNRNNETAFCIAIKENHDDILCLLWESYKKIIESHPDYNTVVGLAFVAVVVDDNDSLTEILEMGNEFKVQMSVKPCNDGWALFEYFAGFSLLHCAVKYIQSEIVHFLLENDVDVGAQDATGSSPLHIALEVKARITNKNSEPYKMNEEIIHSMICATTQELYINPINKYGISHFHIVCTQNKAKHINYFLRNGASISDSVHLNSPIYKGFSPLHFAVKYRCRRTVKVLLDAGANLEQEAYQKVTPLHIASTESSIQMVKFLIKRGADITKQDCDGNTPVHYAFEAKNYEILDFLLTIHAIINSNPVNSVGISHFHIACTRNDVSIVAGFLRNGASVNNCIPIDPSIQYLNYNDDIDWRGCSPLHLAAAFNRMEIVHFLLEQNADVGISDARGFNPFHIACQFTYEKFGALIEDHLSGEKICEESDKDYNLYEDRLRDEVGMENEFREDHLHQFLDVCDDEESTLIDWAPNRKDHVNIIELLIEYSSDVNKIDIFGNGPLFYVCYINQFEKVLSTMNRAINCNNTVRKLLLNSLLKEMYYRRQILLSCVLKCEVNMEQCYNNGSILHYVSVDREYSDTERLGFMKIFLNLGANINATDEKMQTPLHLATQMKDIKAVEILLDYNANVNCIEAQNLATPLHIATSLFCVESIQIIHLLLMRDVDVNMKQLDGKTPLHILLTKRYKNYSEIKSIFYSFVSLGADVNVPDNQGRTPLFFACRTISCEVVEDLLKFGADVTDEDCDGVSIYQCVYGQIKSVTVAFGKLHEDLFKIFLILLKHALKLEFIQLISTEHILQIWRELKKLLKPSQVSYQNQNLTILKTKCCQEIIIFHNTNIQNDITIYDLLFEEDHEMIKYINNNTLKAVVESDSFDETYCCYGYLLKLKFNRGLERSKLLPDAKQCLAYLTNGYLSDCFIEYIVEYLDNSEMRKFIRAISIIKCEEENSLNPRPLKMMKVYSKYARLA